MDINKDSRIYFDVAEADSIVSEQYYTDSDEYTTWNKLDDINKKILITKSTMVIDKLNFRGYKINGDFKLNFPRNIDGVEVELPLEIKVAIIEQGLKEIINKQTDELNMQELGIKKISIDGASTEFTGTTKVIKNKYGVYSDIYDMYLDYWVLF